MLVLLQCSWCLPCEFTIIYLFILFLVDKCSALGIIMNMTTFVYFFLLWPWHSFHLQHNAHTQKAQQTQHNSLVHSFWLISYVKILLHRSHQLTFQSNWIDYYSNYQVIHDNSICPPSLPTQYKVIQFKPFWLVCISP